MMLDGSFLTPPDRPLLSDRTAFDLDVDASPSASAAFQFTLDGLLQSVTNTNGTVTIPLEWWSAGSTTNIGQSYDVRCAEIVSGPAWSAEAAAVGTYIQISATRTWTQAATTPPGKSTTGKFQIVATGTTTPILAEALLTCTAEAEVFS